MQQLELLFFQFTKVRKSSCLILGNESGNVLLRVYEQIDDASHWIPLDAPDRLNQLLIE